MTTDWTPAEVAAIIVAPASVLPPITADQVVAVVPGLDLWDFWPVQTVDGAVADIAGGSVWMALSAPAIGDPGDRHGVARIRLLHRIGDVWHDRGPALPDGFSPGSREWSGSAIVVGNRLTLFFTAAGRRGEAAPTFEQRLFEASATVEAGAGGMSLADWSNPVEVVVADGDVYRRADEASGTIGCIKAFRDPGFFRDPSDGRDYLLFTASLAQSDSAFNGAVGLAAKDAGEAQNWTLRPPLIAADGLNNELERPHVVVRDGRYYLFWSTQSSVFAPGCAGPTGLYGMCATRLEGPYAPLNGTGLVLANPSGQPSQAYSWLVLDTLDVIGFVDRWDPTQPGRAGFGGTIAPTARLALDGASTRRI